MDAFSAHLIIPAFGVSQRRYSAAQSVYVPFSVRYKSHVIIIPSLRAWRLDPNLIRSKANSHVGALIVKVKLRLGIRIVPRAPNITWRFITGHTCYDGVNYSPFIEYRGFFTRLRWKPIVPSRTFYPAIISLPWLLLYPSCRIRQLASGIYYSTVS